jgi:hypothetical protein
MKPQFPDNHLSYRNHRRQFWVQIFLPMILAALLIVVIAVLTGIAAFGKYGEAPRWAAISTIWLVIPVMVFGLLFLAILIGLIYLLAQALKTSPPYTAKAQYYVNRATSAAKRYSDATIKPVMFLQGIAASIKTLFGRN